MSAPAPKFPVRSIGLVLIVSIVVCGWLVWTAEHSAKQITDAYIRDAASRDALSEVARIDEVLTASATLAAATKDPRWKARYDEAAPQIDAAIAKASALASSELRERLKTSTGAANQELVRMEAESLSTADPAAALAILDDAYYLDTKKAYAAGIEAFAIGLKAETHAAVAAAAAARHRSLIVTAAALLLLVSGWFVLIRTLLAWRRSLAEAQQEEAQQREAQRLAEQRLVEEQQAAAEERAAAAERLRIADQNAAHEQQVVVKALAGGLSSLAAGDLTVRLISRFPGDYESLRGNFNASVAKLHDTLSGISDVSRGIRSSTSEISQASNEMARRTETQAAGLEETAAALHQITATVAQTAESAQSARQAMMGAQGEAERGGIVVSDAVEAMGSIERSAAQVANIIGVIDEIAFQTNLLALNAGVEAARAGDAGKGFAVVASEVRALAQRSAHAAKEIKALISESSQQVARGVSLVGETGQALTGIVGQVREISTAISTIAASANDQAAGLAEVNAAVNQIDQVTQQNAAMVEETTAAAHALADETRRLAQMLAVFQTDRTNESTLRAA